VVSEADVSDLFVRLNDRVAVITGAGSGIGEAISRRFAEQGAVVALLDLDLNQAMRVAHSIGVQAQAFECDVSSRASVTTSIAAVTATVGAIDILVNCAGVVGLAPADELSDEWWARTLTVNLTGTFVMSQEVGRLMLERGRGKIINLASQAASVALDGHAAYCASKFGVVGLSKVLASEWAGRGVTVNTISPTVVLTALGRQAWSGPKGDRLLAQIPTGRFAEPEEIAAVASFLASKASDMINGADILVDGGYTIR